MAGVCFNQSGDIRSFSESREDSLVGRDRAVWEGQGEVTVQSGQKEGTKWLPSPQIPSLSCSKAHMKRLHWSCVVNNSINNVVHFNLMHNTVSSALSVYRVSGYSAVMCCNLRLISDGFPRMECSSILESSPADLVSCNVFLFL